MNKNLIVILYFSLAGVGILIEAAVAIFAPEQFDKVTQSLVQILGLASTAAVTIYLLGKQANVLEEVKTQTNGNLTALREQLVQAQAEKDALNKQLVQVVGNSASKPLD